MKKGFTLVELLAVIAIFTAIILIAVPIYNNVTNSVNEKMYETKIKNILSKAENYSTNTNKFVFDVKTLIEQGELTSDNEAGEYKDPRNNRDMQCDIINMKFENNQFSASITESSTCYNEEELENLYGMVEMKLYKPDGSEVTTYEDTEWLNESEIHVKYQLKEDYKEYESYIEEVLWTGDEAKTCTKEDLSNCEYIIKTSEIKNIMVSVQVTIAKDTVKFQNKISKNILIDRQAPSYVENSLILNNDINTKEERRVEFDLSDKEGSGVKEYAIIEGKSCSSPEYESKKKSVQENHIIEYLKNGTYYICVKDKVGNLTSDGNKTKIEVKNVNNVGVTINSFKLNTTTTYNNLSPKATITLATSDISQLKMCVSNTGYLKDCTWEPLKTNFTWNINGTLNGVKRTIYLSVQDAAGNISQKTAEYTPYKDCSQTEKKHIDANFGDCSKPCGGGVQYKRYVMKDKYTGNTSCPGAGQDQRTCNTHSCDPVESMDPNNYESSKNVACNKEYFQRLINNYFDKFKTGLDYQNFRNALYDCGNVTGSIMRKSDAVYQALRNHSRTTIINGNGRSTSCTCYYNRTSKSDEKKCSKPACLREHEQFVSGIIYSGKVFVLSASSPQRVSDWGTSSSKCGDYGFGECANSLPGSCEKWGERYILIGDNEKMVSEATGWGICNRTTNAIINWDECGSWEQKNRIAEFQNGVSVGLITYQDWSYEKESQSREQISYSSGKVYVQIFKI